MSRASARAARAGRSSGSARDIDFPLPVAGIFSEARNSEVSGQLAEVLHNLVSTGFSIKMRAGYAKTNTETCIQRIPYDFGTAPDYIRIKSGGVQFKASSFARTNTKDFSHTSLSNHVLMADGNGDMLICNGTTVAAAVWTTSDAKPVSDFDGVFAHHDRVFAWDSDELAFYYGPDVGAITGNLERFPLANLGNITGTLIVVSSMTINAASAFTDVMVLVTSTGTILLYEGLDPGDPTDWKLLGRVETKARPISKFAVQAYGSDLWILTEAGLVSVRDSIANGVISLASSVARPIQKDLVADIATYGALTPWSMTTLSDIFEVIINIPTGNGFKQYVYTASEKAWSTADWPAKWWHEIGNGSEFTADTGFRAALSEDNGDNGADIAVNWTTGWIRIPSPGTLYYLIPTIIGSGATDVTVSVVTDQNNTPADIAAGTQVIRLVPDNPGAEVALNELIGVNASGRTFKISWSFSGKKMSFEHLVAGVG